MFKVIVAGTRTFNNYPLLKEKLDFFLKDKHPVMIISGGAKGADELGIKYALENHCSIFELAAEWNVYGKSAGPIRNERMAKEAQACVVFWDGISKGTASMIALAKQYGLKLRIVRY